MEVPNQHPYPLIESVMAALQHNNLQPTSEEVADALWLAHKIRQARPLETANSVKADVEESRYPAEEVKQRQKEDTESRSKPSENRKPSVLEDYNVYPPSASGKGLRAGVPFKSPTTSALPGARYLERSLRPFMRRVPSRTKLIFDESATVERIASEEIWAPVLSFARERCFEVALVVEESASMVIWQQTIAEFTHLLSRLGAFRDVRVWKLATDRGQIQLYEGTKQTVGSRRPRHPHELIDPTGRRLILLISDCVASAWHNGQVTKLLASWTEISPVALVQVLPQRLWRGTGLDTAIELSLHARAVNLPNRQLQAESDDLWPDEWPSNGVKMPIVTLEPESLALWARMVTGASVQMAGFLLNPTPPLPMEHDSQESRPAPLSPMERLRHFHSRVTPIAYKLATYFAAVPLTLPVMRLVQHTMLPKSRQVHLAEVFLSGLLKQIETADNPNHIQYDFVDGVRDLLLNSLLVTEAVDVLGTVSNFIAKQTDQPFDFQALIADPTATDGIVISEDSRPFATIAAEVLNRFGGRYVQAGDKLESSIEQFATGKSANIELSAKVGESTAGRGTWQTIKQVPSHADIEQNKANSEVEDHSEQNSELGDDYLAARNLTAHITQTDQTQAIEKLLKQNQPNSQKVRMSELSPDDLLAQATCAVLIDDEIAGTAWLVSNQGHLLTVGHLLGYNAPLNEVKVRFEDDIPQTAHQIKWAFQSEIGIDFAVLQLTGRFDNRHPLPISLARSVTSKFRLRGYGLGLKDPATGVGQFVGVVDRQSSPNYRLFRLSSQELAEPGFSGGAVYCEQEKAVVAIQIDVGRSKIGSTSDTVLAMPLYRIADYWKPLQGLAIVEPQLDIYPALDTSPGLPFINRQEELNRILSPLAPPYHLIDAPAGYGKTALLKELLGQFEKQNLLCAYVSVQLHRTLPSITQALATQLQISLTQDDDTRSLGQKLAQALVQQRGHEFSLQDQGKKGIVLFIDIDKRLWISQQLTINSLFTDFIPDIEDCWLSFEFFQKGHNRFRVVFAGRYLASQIPRRTPFRLSLMRLAPFNYEVVRDMVKAYLPRQRDVAQLTAHLMHISAGHPGVIARVLSLYQERRQDSPDEFLRHYTDEIWENIVWQEGDAIRKDIDKELRRIFDDLTVFRYLNESVLQDLLDQMVQPKYADAFDLADVLTGAYLMNWEGRLLRDNLTRGLLVRRFLREIGTDAFGQHCRRAQNICVTYLQEQSAQMPEKWMIELSFQYLQQHTSDIQSPQKRAEIRQNFLVNVVPYALQLLVNNRKLRQQQSQLRRALEEDWEFRFTVNYYLRKDQYNDEPYRQLQECIDNFFRNQ